MPLQQGSKFTPILTLISLAPGSDRINYSAMQDKTCKIAGPHHTCWVLWTLLYSTTPVLNVSNYKSWLFKDGKTWGFGNLSVSGRHGKTAFTLHCKLCLSPSFFPFILNYLCSLDRGASQLPESYHLFATVRVISNRFFQNNNRPLKTPVGGCYFRPLFSFSVSPFFTDWKFAHNTGARAFCGFFLGIFQKTLLATLSSFRAPALPAIRNKATTTQCR